MSTELQFCRGGGEAWVSRFQSLELVSGSHKAMVSLQSKEELFLKDLIFLNNPHMYHSTLWKN